MESVLPHKTKNRTRSMAGMQRALPEFMDLYCRFCHTSGEPFHVFKKALEDFAVFSSDLAFSLGLEENNGIIFKLYISSQYANRVLMEVRSIGPVRWKREDFEPIRAKMLQYFKEILEDLVPEDEWEVNY